MEVYRKILEEVSDYNKFVFMLTSEEASEQEKVEAFNKLKIFNDCLVVVTEKYREIIKELIIGNGKIGVFYKSLTWEEIGEEFCTNRADLMKEWHIYLFYVGIGLNLPEFHDGAKEFTNTEWYDDF